MASSPKRAKVEESKPAESPADIFFRISTAPSDLELHSQNLASFVEKHKTQNRRVAVVTSGGTVVPLERNMVRCVDNFSTGNRGAASAEEFLAAGYAVVFLTRDNAVQPFHGRIKEFRTTPLDLFEIRGDGTMALRSEVEPAAKQALEEYQKYVTRGDLLIIHFNSLQDYLFLLRLASVSVSELGPKALLYLAAAVSDFFIPEADMATHKLAGTGVGLSLELQPTPKVLGEMRHLWAPQAFCVSFKLETNEEILLEKASKAIASYGMDVVVANLLQTRNDQVILVSPQGNVTIDRQQQRLEQGIVRELVDRHAVFVAQKGHTKE